MIKVASLILLVIGAVALILGVLGIFGKDLVSVNSYALTIIGLVFFLSGTSMLKQRKDTDETR
ncbi:hypothetical protein [Runella sp.]|uniref:hypothetical protein n=1 Tax=Runella sp. TaxID=1960881 RepID=UPI003D09CC91